MKRYEITNAFKLSDGRIVLSVKNLDINLVVIGKKYPLIVDGKFHEEIRILGEITFNAKRKRKEEIAIEVEADLKNITLPINKVILEIR